MIAEQEAARIQIDRILQSETFRTAPVLRRLFAFLADKTLAGEGEAIKEYTIAIDGLGKHHSYDPQHDSTVRIQVGRLRLKLSEYYRLEGMNDSTLIEVPKGRFSLRYEHRLPSVEKIKAPRIEPKFEEPQSIAEPLLLLPRNAVKLNEIAKSSRIFWVVVVLWLVTLLWGVVATYQLWTERSLKSTQASWTPEIEQLWRPFVDPNRPTLVSMTSPLYIGFQGEGVYRDLTLDHWDDVLKSKKIRAIQKALGGAELVPRYYYTGFGDAEAAFEVARLLGARQPELSVARSYELTWQELADNNVVSLGPPRFFDDQVRGLAKQLEYTMDTKRITNLHPRPGEPVTLQDSYPSIQDTGKTGVPDEGEIYVLVTSTPGPLGKGEVRSFSCNHNPGLFAAMQWFTNPQFAKFLVSKLSAPTGSMPRYFQLVLDVRYKDAVPTEVTYVMHRELHLGNSAQAQGH